MISAQGNKVIIHCECGTEVDMLLVSISWFVSKEVITNSQTQQHEIAHNAELQLTCECQICERVTSIKIGRFDESQFPLDYTSELQ